jgi:excisionase family DNA binding protein
MSTSSRRPLASINEVAEYLNVPVATLRQWRHRGTGPRCAKAGRHIRYRWDDVDKWFDEQVKAVA